MPLLDTLPCQLAEPSSLEGQETLGPPNFEGQDMPYLGIYGSPPVKTDGNSKIPSLPNWNKGSLHVTWSYVMTALKVITNILNWIQKQTGTQCSSHNRGVTCATLGAPKAAWDSTLAATSCGRLQ